MPDVKQATAVRVLLFNTRDQLLLQKVDVPGKPLFYITPGGRLEVGDDNLVDAVRREIEEETGIRDFELFSDEPVFTGSHVLKKSGVPVTMTEHFFVAKVNSDNDSIEDRSLKLTEEEKRVFVSQEWIDVERLDDQDSIVVPVNLKAFALACLNGIKPPEVDFSDPPEFSK